MRQVIFFNILLVIMVVVVIPAIIIKGFNLTGIPAGQKDRRYHSEDVSIKVYMHQTGKIVEMSLEEYIKGVVAAEMPAQFELEALKAQAVASRTYAVKNMTLFGGAGLAEQPGADVSTDHRISQAWQSESQLKARWGPLNYKSYWQKISQAVDDTRGLIVTYNGEPINAVFHSTSGERTASAQEVWGFDLPYLQSVVCLWDKQSPRYKETKEIALAEAEMRLGADAGVVAAVQSGQGSVAQIISRTESGRVKQVRIGSKTLSGPEARDRLNLRSSNFTVELRDDKLVFHTIGYGHGVGLSQYGANGMAKEGKNFKDILTYYYKGVTIKHLHGS